MSLIGIVPYKTRFEWTRNKDDTFDFTHKEWMDRDGYEKLIETTKTIAETFAEKIGETVKLFRDDEEGSLTISYRNASGLQLFCSLISETSLQFLKTERDYLKAIGAVMAVSPVGGLIAQVSTSFSEAIEEVQKSGKLTAEESEQLDKLLAKAFG